MSDETTRFDRVPPTEGDSVTPGRDAILAWWDERFAVHPTTFEHHTFWERGLGNIWCVWGDFPDPVDVEGLGIVCLRTRGHDWKPTTNAAQRFGNTASRNVIVLSSAQATRFVAGEDQSVDWDGDRGYLLVGTRVAGERAILGVGQYIDGTLRSVVPKGRRRTLLGTDFDAGP